MAIPFPNSIFCHIHNTFESSDKNVEPELQGYPLWNHTYVYNNRTNHENVVAIPLVQSDTSIVAGLIVVTFQPSGVIINGITRQEVFLIDEGNTKSKLGYATNMYKFEDNIFGEASEAMEEACCELQQKFATDPETGVVPCAWVEIELCYDELTNSSWVGGLHNIPPHLDHDLDGIPNDQDQDWYEWSTRYNVSQLDFQDHIIEWWEDNYENQYGDYELFWEDPEDWYDENSVALNLDWDEFWDDIADFFDDLSGGLGDIFDDIGGFFGNLWDDIWDDGGYGCYDWGIDAETPIESRTIICNWFYIYDCPTLTNPWWTFHEGFADADVFRDRVNDYWRIELMDKIDFWDLYSIAQGCDPWSIDFEQCVQYKYTLARRTALTNIISYYNITEYDLNQLDELTLDCHYTGFEDCVLEIYMTHFNWYFEDIDG